MTEISKQYQSVQVEKKWYQYWEDKQLFHAERSHGGESFSMVIPPPNVTGALHLGHALNNTIQDILIRWQRMKGKNTLWMPGTDHAGIATQAVVERRLFEEESLTRHDIGREALEKRIWNWKDEYEARILGQLRKMGSSCDWQRTRFTLDDVCAKAVRHTFFKFFNDDLIYRGKRLVNWDTHLQTAVADDEIFYETVQSFLWHFKYPLSDGSGYLIIATTRPETMLGDTAVAVHPKDGRYQHLIGKSITLPIVNREIPIIADGILVDPEFGTGCVKVTPAHDPNDYQTALRNQLPMINILSPDGKINENGSIFSGQDRYEARKNLVKKLEEMGLVEKIDPYETQVGHSDRSKTPVEPYLSDQWFVNMSHLATLAIDSIESEQVKIHPSRYAKSCIDWLSEKRDWCISRQLWWGHRIPIWHCENCTEEDLAKVFSNRKDVVWKKNESRAGWLICSLEDLPHNIIGEDKLLIQDPDVLDTWFSSALWPHSTLGWPDDNKDLEFYYPTNVLVTSRDIISLWVARMIITSLVNRNQIPFHEVYIHPKILDGEGRTMSKSLGNGVDPLDIIEKYGADALRFTMANLCTENQDARLPVVVETLSDGRTINTSDRFEVGRNFCNKIWNASRFLLLSIDNYNIQYELDQKAMSDDDLAIMALLYQLTVKVDDSFSKYRFSEATQVLYDFFWKHFCDRYIESVKPILWDGTTQDKQRVQKILFTVLSTFLRLLHPLMPFVTEELWHLLHESVGINEFESIMISVWPVPHKKFSNQPLIDKIEYKYELIRAARNLRSEYGITPSVKVKYSLKVKDQSVKTWVQKDIESFKKLIHAKEILFIDLNQEVMLPSESSGLGVIYLHLEGVLDINQEKNRIDKKVKKFEMDIQTIEKKLNNPNFSKNAPEAVVVKEKEKLFELQNKYQKLIQTRSFLLSTST